MIEVSRIVGFREMVKHKEVGQGLVGVGVAGVVTIEGIVTMVGLVVLEMVLEMVLTSVIFDIMFLRILTNMSVLNLLNSTEDLFDNDDMERPFNRIRGLAGSERGHRVGLRGL